MMNECSDLIDEVNEILKVNDTCTTTTVCTDVKDELNCDKIISCSAVDCKNSINDINNDDDVAVVADADAGPQVDDDVTSTSTCTYTPETVQDNQINNSPIKINNDNVSYKKNNFIDDNTYLEVNNNERVIELEALVVQQKNQLEEYEQQLREADHRYQQSKNVCGELDSRLQMAIRQSEIATKEKENMVMRYAVSEKVVLEQRAGRENAEKKLKDAYKEKDLLQSKLTTMISEKNRICQMFDNKGYELRSAQQELEKAKFDLNSLETKLKWSQNSLRTEMELHKECTSKNELLTIKLQEATNEIEKTKKETQDTISSFYHSQDNRAHVLDQQLKELQAILILEKHEKDEKEQRIFSLKNEFDKIQNKHQNLIEENNNLSLKVQQLERERLENEQKLSELRICADQHRQDEASLNTLTSTIEQLKIQLLHEQEQKEANIQQVSLLQQRNTELETDMESCRIREAEMLLFTQQLTDKNVRLQSEFSALEIKVQQLTCEQTLLKRNSKEQETRANMLAEQLEAESTLRQDESQVLARHLAEKTKLSEQLAQQLDDQRGENLVIKRKLDQSVKEVTKELQQCRKRLEQYEKADVSRSSSSSSLNVVDHQTISSSPSPNHQQHHHHQHQQNSTNDHQIIQPENALDRQVLIDHIIKLQRGSAKKSEKIDFLEEHVQTLVSELQRKSRLLQAYMVREQTGALSSNRMDDNKAELAKMSGVMASVYGSRVQDTSLTLELSLDINRKLQAVLEDTLLKNITLKENVDTLGAEIDRLNKLRN